MTTTTTSRFPLSLPRTLGHARWNAVLLLRSRLAIVYAVVIPIIPLALLFTGDRGDGAIGATAVTSSLTMAVLFPVFYNVLSQFVTRRDELVLKRLRTGEARDPEILAAMALPGAAIAVVVGLFIIPIAMAFGQPFPFNPLLYVVTVLVAAALFAVLADGSLDQERGSSPADQLAGDRARPRRPVGERVPGAGATLARPDARCRAHQSGAHHVVRIR